MSDLGAPRPEHQTSAARTTVRGVDLWVRSRFYHRVSTLDQNPTLPGAELRAAARRLGYRIVLDVEETGSGARNDPPEDWYTHNESRRSVIEQYLSHSGPVCSRCQLERAPRERNEADGDQS